MKSILYIMHISWGFIKQRPHFIAEELSREYDVDVMHRYQHVHKSQLVTKEESAKGKISFIKYDIIPFDKIPILRCFNTLFFNRYLIKSRITDINKYDILWFTSPYSYWFFKDIIPNDINVYYDCMDDMSEFPELTQRRKKIIAKAEQSLLNRVSHVFFSSDYLKDKIIKKYHYKGRYSVVNNAVELPTNDYDPPQHIKEKLDFVKQLSNPIIYIGVVSSWFDVESMMSVLHTIPSVNLVLIGPQSQELPNHPRLHVIGTVPRDSIFSFMQIAVALIMPFKITELVKSVNPVKLYEYIYSGKPVIASRYSETEKFLPYVSLYNDRNELISIINDILSSKITPLNKVDIEAFVNSNTWQSRGELINLVLRNEMITKEKNDNNIQEYCPANTVVNS